MILRRGTLERVQEGTISLVFRRWRRPTVRPGGSLRTAVGVLAIEAVDPVSSEDITPAEASAAGFEDVVALRKALDRRPEGQVYRIRIRFAGADPRVALRETVPEGDELQRLVQKLIRRGARADPTPRTLLELIGDRPATRAAELADALGLERLSFKRRVRALKELGLTESLEVGYRLSPRGAAVLRALAGPDGGGELA